MLLLLDGHQHLLQLSDVLFDRHLINGSLLHQLSYAAVVHLFYRHCMPILALISDLLDLAGLAVLHRQHRAALGL